MASAERECLVSMEVRRASGTGCNVSQPGCWVLYKNQQRLFKLSSHLSSPSKQLKNIFLIFWSW